MKKLSEWERAALLRRIGVTGAEGWARDEDDLAPMIFLRAVFDSAVDPGDADWIHRRLRRRSRFRERLAEGKLMSGRDDAPSDDPAENAKRAFERSLMTSAVEDPATEALAKMVELGVEPAWISTVVRELQDELVFRIAYLLSDSLAPFHDLEGLDEGDEGVAAWGFFATDPDTDAPRKQIGVLHEYVRAANPRVRDE